MTEDQGWVTNDPGLICMIGDEANCKGRACMPLSEYAPLIERVVALEAALTRHRELLAQIEVLASAPQ